MKLTIDDKKKEVHISEAEEWSIFYDMEDLSPANGPTTDEVMDALSWSNYELTTTTSPFDGYVESSAH